MDAVVRLNPQSEMRLIADVWQRRWERTSIYGLNEISKIQLVVFYQCCVLIG